MQQLSFGSGADPNRKTLSSQLAAGAAVSHLSPPTKNPRSLFKQSLHGAYGKKQSPMKGLKMNKKAAVNPDFILEGLKYAGASAHQEFMEKRAFTLPLSWFGGSKATGLGALIGGLAPAVQRASKLHGLSTSATAATKARGLAASAAKHQAAALKAGGKFKPTWEQRMAGRDTTFLDAVKGKNWKDNPMDMLKAYLPQVASQGAQGAALGGAAGKVGDTLLAMYKRKKFMDTAKKVAVPAAAGLGAYALLKD
jgi:hypothetical protein